MLRLSCYININGLILDFVNEVEIKSSWDKLTDTAKITLPRKLNIKDADGTLLKDFLISGNDAAFKRGDPVDIQLGYGWENVISEFKGFISDVSPNRPFVIHCQDVMWKLKQVQVTKSWYNTTLKQLISDVLTPLGISFIVNDCIIGSIRPPKRFSISQLFDHLREKYHFEIWARDGIIHAGLAYELATQPSRVAFSFGANGGPAQLGDVISDNGLTYTRNDDLFVQVKANRIMPTTAGKGNRKETVFFGDVGGAIHEINCFNATSTADLTRMANSYFKELKHSGFKGSFSTFGSPSVKHGDIAELKDNEAADRNGAYQIKSVTKQFGVRGFRQEIELDRAISLDSITNG